MKMFARLSAAAAAAIAVVSPAAAVTAPADYFSEAMANTNNIWYNGEWVNPVPGASTGQIASPVASITNPQTGLYLGAGGLNACCGTLVGTGVASASADRLSGALHAKAGLTGPTEFSQYGGFPAAANALFGDTLYFSSSYSSTTISFSIHIDGELTSFGDIGTASGQPSASLFYYFGNVGYSGWYGFSPAPASPNVSGTSRVKSWDLVNDPTGHMLVDETLTGSFSFTGPTATLPVFFMLSVAGQYGFADFSNTATLSFDTLPDGVSFTSASGDFLAGPSAIPELSTWAMMLLGFAGLGAWGRRKVGARQLA